jgi:hypothetical protein
MTVCTLLSLYLTACTLSTTQSCEMPAIDRITRVWNDITPADLSLLAVQNFSTTVERQTNLRGTTMTNVQFMPLGDRGCRCCLILSFEDTKQEPSLIAATMVRRFSSTTEALAFARTLWHDFANADLPIDEDRFVAIANPYVTQTATSSRFGHAFMGELSIDGDLESHFAQ